MQNSENKTIVITLQKVFFKSSNIGHGDIPRAGIITHSLALLPELLEHGYHSREGLIWGTPYVFISSDSDYPTIETTQPKIPTLNLHSRRSLYDLLCIPREGIIARYNEKKQNWKSHQIEIEWSWLTAQSLGSLQQLQSKSRNWTSSSQPTAAEYWTKLRFDKNASRDDSMRLLLCTAWHF